MVDNKIDKYIHEMANRYTTQFNVYRDERIGEIPLDFYAQYQRKDEKYLMTKAIKVWGVENQQYVFVKKQESPLSIQEITAFGREIDKQIKEFIPAKQEHMSTVFLGVIVTNQLIQRDVIKEVKRSRKLRFMKYGLHGWAERYIAIVQLDRKEIHVNKKARDLLKGFEQTLTGEVDVE
ncbi:hypothetical protein [Halalkalibacterium ligniniphilum]|uniref:hypothetical protein n=1 Tax=Halalkalibacterium ligniniphilum TaxID=1134413 RepID=UPI00034B7137|nr:hypothetical protein [Halalkalibacterium ligniniphilum]